MSKKEKRIYERNTDSGVIKSRKSGDYGNETIEPSSLDYSKQLEGQHKVRKEVLNELWAANKVNHEGHWYVRLTDIVNIVGDYDDLYENESRS